MFKKSLFLFRMIIVLGLTLMMGISSHSQAADEPSTPIIIPSQTGLSRGYTTTPQELVVIREEMKSGVDLYEDSVDLILDEAEKGWNYGIDRVENCGGSNSPGWIDEEEGVSRLYARALAYHLTLDERYRQEVRDILERIMSENFQIDLESTQCRLNFSWGIPEIIASADLIEAHFHQDNTCTGPLTTDYDDDTLGMGNCKQLLQNWLAKNPYYVISLTSEESLNNWGAAATNATAYIADYLWDRPEIILQTRTPDEINRGNPIELSPMLAFQRANNNALNRMNGYRVDYWSNYACDSFDDQQQLNEYEPVKSQITPEGIIPDDARRDEYCNIQRYDGTYQNYPQLHLGHNIQQCELMLRRGDNSCYENIDMQEIPQYEFLAQDSTYNITYLRSGRGSIERAINAIIVDSDTEWRHDSALEVAYRYYYENSRENNLEAWFEELDRPADCAQNICFGTLTHGFNPDGTPRPIVVVEQPFNTNP